MIKKYLLELDKSRKNLRDAIIDFKIATHDLDKMGLDVNDIYEQIDELGIEYIKLQNITNEKIIERLKGDK